ncbi:30S ribosomal protein S17 [Spirochaetota bacterium]|nr:30S ribosomal protein S17 [Spirochaetota bacterium]
MYRPSDIRFDEVCFKFFRFFKYQRPRYYYITINTIMEKQANTEQAAVNNGQAELKSTQSSEKSMSYKKKFKGTVVSTKSDKTVVVRVDRKKTHSRYHKKIKWSKRYLVHDETNQLNLGDEIEFIESRPLSKRKCFNFVSLIKKN